MKRYCSERCRSCAERKRYRDKYSDKLNSKSSYKKVDPPFKPCSWCDKSFKPKSKNAVFCSKECCRKSYYKGKKKFKLVKCINCDKQFLNKGRGKFCSNECRYNSLLVDKKTKKCVICKSDFKTADIRHTTCSDECRSERKKLYRRNYEKNVRYKKVREKLKRSIKSRLHYTLVKGKESKSTEEILGYKIKDLKTSLEGQFTTTMTWDNYGDYWHIDHKLPVSYFNYQSFDDPEFNECWKITNLQPLEAIKNLKKSNKILPEYEATTGTDKKRKNNI